MSIWIERMRDGHPSYSFMLNFYEKEKDEVGFRPVKAVLGMDLFCVFEKESQVRAMPPDQELLKKLPGRIQNATTAGDEADCVSRSFCPKLSVAEDPVCGSAHCQIADYWSPYLKSL